MAISAPKISYKTKRSSDYLAPLFLCEAEEDPGSSNFQKHQKCTIFYVTSDINTAD